MIGLRLTPIVYPTLIESRRHGFRGSWPPQRAPDHTTRASGVLSN